jgi:hypothetical protein
MKKNEIIIRVIIDFVKQTGKPIYYLTLAKKVGLLPKNLFKILKRIGLEAIAKGEPLWDAWVAYDDSDVPAPEFFLQKIEVGYLKEGIDWIEFLRRERQNSLSVLGLA